MCAIDVECGRNVYSDKVVLEWCKIGVTIVYDEFVWLMVEKTNVR